MNASLKIKITSHQEDENGKISYVVQVRGGKQMKVTRLRYSEFRQIHDQLQRLISKLKLHIQLPPFPSRRLLGSTNKSQQSILQRKKQLSIYLESMLSIEKLHLLEIIKKNFVPEAQPTTHNHDFNMQICIDRYTLVQDVVIYFVRLRDLNSREEWTFKTRYSELRNLHEALEAAKIKNLPIFPKKKIFGITNDNPENIQKRREELERYFNQVFTLKEALESEAIQYFVEESKKMAAREKIVSQAKKKKKQ